MQPVSVYIEGCYWDSQIYSGDLILFDADGGLHRINWNGVIDEIASSYSEIQTALRVAFSDSDLFYNPKVRRILDDPTIAQEIQKQLRELAKVSVQANDAIWAKFMNVADAPFKFLTTDTDIYYNHLIAAGDEGLFSAPRGAAGTSDMLSKIQKHHDGKILQVKASNKNTAVAAAAGADGMFEFSVEPDGKTLLYDQTRLSNLSCSGCDWAFNSLFGWDDRSAFLANFKVEEDPRSKRKMRRFDRVIEQAAIFDGQDFQINQQARVWGSHEKVFCVSGQELKVLNFIPSRVRKARGADEKKEEGPQFSTRGMQSLSFDANDIIATGTAPFGNVIELEDSLVVLRSDGDVSTFEGAPVHWRVFPRSEHYSNQLHIIYDDYIRIVSFVHDYFVDQKQKLVGFSRGVSPSNEKVTGSSKTSVLN